MVDVNQARFGNNLSEIEDFLITWHISCQCEWALSCVNDAKSSQVLTASQPSLVLS